MRLFQLGLVARERLPQGPGVERLRFLSHNGTADRLFADNEPALSGRFYPYPLGTIEWLHRRGLPSD